MNNIWLPAIIASSAPTLGGGFDPLTIPGLQALWLLSEAGSLWQDTSATTPVTAADDPIGRIDDLTGNGHHLLVYGAGSARRPLYKPAAQNGLAGARFVDDGDTLVTAVVAGWTQPLQIVLLYKLFSLGSPGTRDIVASGYEVYTNHNVGATYTRLYSGIEFGSATAPAYASAALITLAVDGASSYIRANGSQIAASNAGPQGWGGLYIGGSAWERDRAADMELYAAAVVKPPITGSDLADAEDHFIDTWGL